MARIHVLEKAVAELIAAGEVVERPASIVKELIENSIDAGADSITVELEGGGVRLIRITDSGCGIARDDMPRAFLRHATSKVQTAKDLDGILTLGFRGEALASVAAMCRVEMISKTAEEDEGTRLVMEDGEIAVYEPVGCPTGTIISVRDIFYNTPARQKFLKKDVAEGNSAGQIVEKYALAHPEIAFRLIREGQTKLQTSGNGDLLSVVYAVLGKELSKNMLPVDYSHEGLRVTGYISHPDNAKPSRTYQNFFINSRFVRTRTASAALEEGFKGNIMVGKFPACVLNLQMQPDFVDVNVHPAKIEVRFVNEKPVFHVVYYGVKSALQKIKGAASEPVLSREVPVEFKADEGVQARMSALQYRSMVQEQTTPPVQNFFSTPLELRSYNQKSPQTDDSAEFISFSDKIPPRTYRNIDIAVDDAPVVVTSAYAPPEPVSAATPVSITFAEEKPHLRVVGELFDTYILAQQGEALLLIDKHAAHERLKYEEILRNISFGNRQLLLSPQRVSLPMEEYSAVVENLPLFEKMGFLVEDFGEGSVLVRETPIELSRGDVAEIVEEAADKIKANRRNLTPAVLDRLFDSIACKSAVRAGDKNSKPELEALVKLLQENPEITHCPHGRPIFVTLTRGAIEKMFGRLG